MAPKRLLEQPPPANSSSADESEEEEEEVEVEEEETQSKSQNQNKKGVVAGADEEEKSEDDEEEEEEEEEDDDNEEGEEEEEAEKAKSRKPTVAKPSESSGSGSETESDDNTPPSPSLSGFTVKPIASKPMDDNDNDDEDVDTTTTTSAKPNKKKVPAARPNKRAAEAQESEPDEKDSKSNNKKRKVTSNGGGGGGGEEDDSKKVTRVWSEEDEIAVLKGMTEYKTKKGADPYADMGAFHEFIKKSLNADVKKNQLVDKIRRLKRKYLNNVAKCENGNDPVISKPHELKSFQLSKKIWGSGDNKNPSNGNLVEDNNLKSNSKKNLVPSTPKSKRTATVLAKDETGKKEKKREKAQANNKAKIVKEKEEGVEDEQDKEMEDVEEVNDFWEKYPSLKNSLTSSELEHFVSSIKKVMPLIESSKVKKLDKKWKDLEIDEMEIFTRRAQLLGEQVKMVSDFVKSK